MFIPCHNLARERHIIKSYLYYPRYFSIDKL